MIRITSKGDLTSTKNYLTKLLRGDIFSELDRYGAMGVEALARATPVESGLTANSWYYKLIGDRKHPGIEWRNRNSVNGTTVAVLIQYGHGTGTGGYVPGRDFINPAMRPIFDRITSEVWKKVKL